jgi:predicted nucleic acid-binding protein
MRRGQEEREKGAEQERELPRRYVIDASVLLMRVFEDEEGHELARALLRDYSRGMVELMAPTLLIYEVTNGVLQTLEGRRPGRGLSPEKAEELLVLLEGYRIPLLPVPPRRMLQLAWAYRRTAYDAAYLALAEQERVPLITGDIRLYRAVRDRVDWVRWIGDHPIYPNQSP